MPPKAKYTREEIVASALDLVREKGIEALTARELGNRLGCSSRPVFTAFQNMEELKQEVMKAAGKMMSSYFQASRDFTPEFKKAGMMMIRFAVDEPKLFQLLLMQESPEERNYNDMLRIMGADVDYCIDIIKRDYALDDSRAQRLFDQLWLHSYAIGVLCATKMCRFTEEEISRMLGEVFAGILYLIKSGKIDTGLTDIQVQGDVSFGIGDIPRHKE